MARTLHVTAVALTVCLALSAPAQESRKPRPKKARGTEERLDVGLLVKGWLRKEGDARAPFDNPTLSGSLTYAWGEKGRLSRSNSHVRFARSTSANELDNDSSTTYELGQDWNKGELHDSWDFRYVRIPGRRFDALTLGASREATLKLGPPGLEFTAEAGLVGVQNMNGRSRDTGFNLHVDLEATLSYSAKLGSPLGPFDRFEVSSSLDRVWIASGKRPRSESNVVNSIGFAGRFDDRTRVSLKLVQQNGNPSPTFPSRSRLSVWLSVNWRVKF